MADSEAEIRELSEPSEMKDTVETLQSAFVGIDDIETIPDHIFTASAEHGIMLGAYDGGQQVGFAMGIGEVGDGDSVYLHATGVLPEYQDKSLGEELLREFARNAEQRGLEHVSLTYDPLLGGNAKLNIGKAGGTTDTYKRNLYGEQENEANSGESPTDRFEVDFDLTDSEVQAFLEGGEADRSFRDPETVLEVEGKAPDVVNSSVEQTQEQAEEQPPRYEFTASPESEYVAVEIPRDLSEVKEAETEYEARFATRAAFEGLFEDDYRVVDFISGGTEDFENNTYILEKQ
ncbi:MAG: GNAT family N-acetyltransferase [Candidatus Nanohaloarchaea archaeon]